MSNVSKDFVTKNGIVVKGTNFVTDFTSQTNALQVDGGAAIAKNVLVGSTATIYGQTKVNFTEDSTNTTTGALIVAGGAAIGKNLYVDGDIIVNGDIVGASSTATNLAGGAAGQLVYQSSTGTTGFVGPGTAGQLLVSTGAAAPVYTNTNTIQVGFADVAGSLLTANTSTQQVGFSSNLLGGTAGQLVYQSASNTTGFVNTSTAGDVLTSGGVGSPVYVSTGSLYVGRASIADTATTANNLSNGLFGEIPYQSAAGSTAFIGTGTNGSILVMGANTASFVTTSTVYVNGAVFAEDLRGGAAGQIVYQSATNTTDFVGPGTAGEVLTSNGANAPVYTSTSSLYVGRALVSDSTTGNAGSANNISGGALGQIPYQLSASTTAFIGTGTNGSILLMGANTASFVTTASVYVNSSVFAEDLRGGVAGQLVYQSASNTTDFVGTGTAGQVLTSSGTGVPTYVSTGSLYVGRALIADSATGGSETANNLSGGTAGQIVYQSAPGVTAFASTGTFGQFLMSNGVGAPLYQNTLTQNGGNIVITSNSEASSTNTGALQIINGGLGVGGGGFFGGIVTATLFVGTLSGVASSAINIVGGTFGQLVYQSAPGVTAFVTTASVGEVLTSNGVGAPAYVSTGSLYVGRALVADSASGTSGSATNIAGGTAGQVPYQTGVGATSFFGPGTAGQLLVSAGTSAPVYTNTGSIQVGFAANLLAGGVGSLPYQSAADTTAMLSLSGTTGALLTAGATSPSYITQVTARNGTGDVSTASGQSFVVSSGGLGVIGDSHFADNVHVRKDFLVEGGTTFNGTVTFNGTATFVYSTNTFYTDNILNLHTPQGGVANTWTSNDGKDIGLVFHNFVDGYDNDSFLGWANDTGYLEWYSKGTEDVSSGTYVGTAYGIFKSAGARFVGTNSVHDATSGAVQITGGLGVGGSLFVAGVVTATSFVGAISGTTTDVAGGTAGQLLYQVSTNNTDFVGPGTAGQLLVSAGTSAPVYTNTSSIYVDSSVNAQTLFGGTAGQLVYQSATGTSAFAGPGTAGQILVSAGATAPVYTNTSSIQVAFADISGGLLAANTSTQQVGFSANLLGGTTGQLVYQSASNTTAFVGPGTAGQVLTSNGAGAPVYTSTSSLYVGRALIADSATGGSDTANNLNGGALGQIPYQLAAGSTAFIGTGTNGSILVMGANTASFITTSSIYVNSSVNAQTLFGGTAGQLVYQSATGTSAFAGPGNAGEVLTSSGTGAPTYVSTGSLYVGRAVVADTATGNAGSADNISGGALGQIPYQLAAGSTAFIGTGTNGSILVMGANTASFVTTSTVYVNSAVFAEDLRGGTAGQLVYQSLDNTTAFVNTGTAGEILVSAGVSAPVYTSTSSIYVGFSNSSNNVRGGSAGQLVYQSATDATAFAGPGTAGQLLVSAGAAAPVYTNTSSIQVGFAANVLAGAGGSIVYQSNTNTTSFLPIGLSGQILQVNSGATAPEWVSTSSVYAAAAGSSQNLFGGTAGQLVYQSTTGTTAFVGPGTAGQLLVSAGTSAPIYTNTSSIYVNSSVNAQTLFGGTAGQLVYQSATGTSAFAGPGTAGEVLTSSGTGAPTYVSTGSLYVGRALVADSVFGGVSTSTNIAGGTAGQVPYQSAPGATAFFGPGTAGQLLVSAGAAAPVYTNTSSIHVAFADVSGSLLAANTSTQQVGFSANILGGTAGQLVYQSASNVTAFVGPGNAGEILTSGGTGAPTYVSTGTLYVNRAVTADSATASSSINTQQQTANAAYYPTFVDSNNASPTAESLWTTSSFSINPSTGNVGVGTASPSARLHVQGGDLRVQSSSDSVNGILRIYDTAASTQLQAFATSTTATLGVVESKPLSFITNNTERMRITEGGLVGIGTASPTGSLTVVRDSNSSVPSVLAINNSIGVDATAQFNAQIGSSSAILEVHNTKGLRVGTTQSANFNIVTADTTRIFVESTGNVGIGTTSPTTRLTVSGGMSVSGISTFTNVAIIDNATSVHSTATGALRVFNGGLAVGGGGFFGGVVTATTFVGALTGTASIATNIAGGTAGQLVYQSATGTTAFAGPGNAGEILTSNGTSAPSYVTTTSLYVGRALVADSVSGGINQANNLSGGELGQIPYQLAAGSTAFIGTGTQGSMLVMGANTASFVTTSSIYVNAAANSQNLFGGSGGSIPYQSSANNTAMLGIGASNAILVSNGSVPSWTVNPTIGGNVIITGDLTVQGTTTQINSTVTNVSDPIITVGTGPNGALPIVDDGKYRGIAFAWTGTQAGLDTARVGFFGFDRSSLHFTFITSATINNEVVTPAGGTTRGAIDANLAGGTTGQLVYQSATDTTAFVGPGTTGQILVSGGASAPVYTNTGSIYVGSANNALNLFSGTAGQLVYQSAPGVTAFVTTATAGQVLTSGGVGAPAYVTTGSLYVGRALVSDSSTGNSGSATNIAGGTAGQVPYQTGVGATSFFGPGTAGQILVSAGTSAPTYTNTGSIYVNRAVVSDTALTQAQTANATYYPTFVDANNSSAAAEILYTSSTFVINPSTGNVGIGTSTPGYKLEVNGSFAATTKSFVIDHPTKPGKKLRYGSLEGPENGVYVRGQLKSSAVIELPEYWTKLIDPSTITVNLTSVGKYQQLYVKEIVNNTVVIENYGLSANDIDCFYTVWAERCDVEKLIIETDQ